MGRCREICVLTKILPLIPTWRYYPTIHTVQLVGLCVSCQKKGGVVTNGSVRIFGIRAPIIGGILIGFVVLLSCTYVAQAYWQLESVQKITRSSMWAVSAPGILPEFRPQNDAELIKLHKLYQYVSLERDGMIMRHNRTVVALETRTWLQFSLSLFGAMLISIGAMFVLGKITSENFLAEAEAKDIKFAFATASPGLVLAVVGATLMIVASVVDHPINTVDAPAFVPYFEGKIGPVSVSGMEGGSVTIERVPPEELQK